MGESSPSHTIHTLPTKQLGVRAPTLQIPRGATMDTRTDSADALASFLASAEPSASKWDELNFDALSPAGRIDALVACERLQRRAHALLARALGVLDRARAHESELDRGCTEAEVCAALRWSGSTAQARLADDVA